MLLKPWLVLWPTCFILSGTISYSSPVAHWTPSDLGSTSCSVISFCLFILFMGFLWQEYWSGLPFPPPVDHVLSELSTMTRPSWVALHGMAHSFIELRKPLRHDKAVIHEGVTTSLFLLTSTRAHRLSHKLFEVSLTIPGVYSLQVYVLSSSLTSATLLNPWNFCEALHQKHSRAQSVESWRTHLAVATTQEPQAQFCECGQRHISF